MLSQPIWMVTQAVWPGPVRARRAEGNMVASSATAASRISVIGPPARAWATSSAARCTLWVPSTTST